MRIGLIDVDMESRGKCTFPNLALMKLSAWHKAQGDHVEWYLPIGSGHMDRVYMSKVFGDEYTKDYAFPVDADEICRGGSGYAISIEDGKEVYRKERDPDLPCEVVHMMPDYSIYEQYGIHDTAYGFMTRGCPRGCAFCMVKDMQGRKVTRYSPLNEFWNGQKNIVLLDPNITASRDCVKIFEELAETKANVDFSQGLDIRMLTKEKIEALKKVKFKGLHFAWDNPEDDLSKHFELVKEMMPNVLRNDSVTYVLTNYNSTHEQDMYRVMWMRKCNTRPYIMIYRKPTAPAVTKRLQSWCNNARQFWKYETFEDFQRNNYKEVIV